MTSSYNQLRRFFDLSMDMFCIANMDGYFVWVNPAFEKILGYTQEELTEKPFMEFVHPDDIPATQNEMNRLDEGRPTLHFENRYLCKDGSYKYLSWTSSPPSREGLLYAVARDLTERRLAENELVKAKETLEKRILDRTRDLQLALEYRDEFLSIASHELKSPLTALKLKAQLRKRHAEDGTFITTDRAKLAESFDNDIKQLDLLSRLVDDMLDITSVRTGNFVLKRENTDLSRVVTTVIDKFCMGCENNKTLLVLDQSESIVGNWDAQRLEQMVTNLISNSLKYGNSQPVKISVLKKSDKALIHVKDNGIGIPEKDQTKVFQLYERVPNKSNTKGLGLGLYIVKQIVDAHQGHIRLESQEGAGTSFTVELPLS